MKKRLSINDVNKIMDKHIIPFMKVYKFDEVTEKMAVATVRKNLERLVKRKNVVQTYRR